MNYKRPVIVGLFILIGIGLFVAAILALGGQKKTFIRTFPLNAVFRDVEGLQPGNNVWFAGVKVGTVKKVGFYGNSEVRVVMNIQTSIRSHIRKNATVKISSDGLIGNRIIVITGGSEDFPEVEKDDFLKVRTTIGTAEILDTLQANNRNLLDITRNLKSISHKIDSGNGTLGVLLNDHKMADKLDASLSSLQETLANFRVVSQKGKDVVAGLQSFSAKLTTQGNLINDLISDTAIYKDLKGSVAQLREVVNKVSHFTDELNKAGEALNRHDNMMGLMLNDSVAAATTKRTLGNLELSSIRLSQDLEAIQHNFLFRGFFRKQEKARAKAAKDSLGH